MAENTIDPEFSTAFDKAIDLHEDGLHGASISHARNILSDPEISRYRRIQALLLLAGIVQDVREARSSYAKAEMLWLIERCIHPPGEDLAMDVAWGNLRETLDGFKEKLYPEVEGAVKGESRIEDAVKGVEGLHVHDRAAAAANGATKGTNVSSLQATVEDDDGDQENGNAPG